jgi:hypothetical protein
VAQHYKNSLSRHPTIAIDGAPIDNSNTKSSSLKESLDKMAHGRLINRLTTEATANDVAKMAALLVSESRRAAGLSNDAGLTREREEGVERRLMEIYRAAKDGRVTISKGRLFEVELAPKEHEYLDWDKPYDEQTPEVKKALEAAGILPEDFEGTVETGGSIYRGIGQQEAVVRAGGRRGGGIAKDSYSDQQAASEALAKAGIPGIKYLDGSSRGKGEGAHNYVIFDAKHVDVVAKFSRQGEASPWYSELARQVGAVKTESAPAAQWIGTLKGLKGVKADELEWSGVLDWLGTREGKVTKAEVEQFLAQNGVKIEETMLGDSATEPKEVAERDRVVVRLSALGYEPDFDIDGQLDLIRQMSTGEEYSLEDIIVADDMDGEEGFAASVVPKEARTLARTLADITALPEYGGPTDPRETKFSGYTLPGGQNYRELLLTLPERTPPNFPDFETYFKAKYGEYADPTNPAHGMARRRAQEAWDANGGKMPVDDFSGERVGLRTDNFTSSHFDQSNILAHVRFDERTDAEGKRVLFIEEFQSDWAQKGKREGFKDANEARAKAKQDALAAEFEALKKRLRELPFDLTKEPAEAAKEATRLREREGEIVDEMNRGHDAVRYGVPSAPFVGKTEAWVALAVKRMIRYAVDNGFDRVAWTTGEQQADRYDLSQHIDRIEVSVDEEDYPGVKFVNLFPKGRSSILLKTRDGKVTDDPSGGFAGKDLADVVGKDLAAKIAEKDRLTLKGLDLKIGGEGMVAFYDRIVPNTVNDVLKKLGGGRVGKVDIQDPSLFRKGGFVGNDDALTQQPGFDITPALAERAKGPLPMFARSSANLPPLNFPGGGQPKTPAAPGATPPQGWQAPDTSRLDNLIYTLQDKHVDTKRVLSEIAKAQGQVTDASDPYLAEELYHGRTAKAVADFLEGELKPLLKDMASRGVKIEDFEEWLHARHAVERNAQIARINQQLPDGGSGMTNADARALLAAARAAGKDTAYQALAKQVDAINAKTRQEMIAYGLEAPSTVAAWQQAYQHYVPLQREDMEGGLGTGQGFSVRGNATKRATGSTRKVVNILAHVAMRRERTVTRGEKKRVGAALLGLAAANPNPAFWRVDQPPMVSRVDPRTGLVTRAVDPLYKSRDNVIVVPMADAAGNVIDHAVVFNEHDERAMRMAKSLKNLDVDSLEGFLGAVAKLTRYFASINTQYNPIFGVVNVTRDAQGALLNLTTTPIAGKQAEVLGHMPSALRGIYSDLRATRAGGQPTSSWAQLFEEFQKEGAQTGYRDLFHTSDERAKELQREIDKAGAGASQIPRKAWDAVFDWLSDYNLAMENAARLSAYKVGIDSGMSKARAASMAKNLTVNFNRKGQATPQLGALYAFFNASAQGTARLAQTMAGPKGRQIAAGGVLLGVLQAVALAAAGFGEDEPPDFVRERNLVIPIGDKKYLTIPMPLGFHILPNIGRTAAEFWLSGFKRGGERAAKLFASTVEAFSPVGGGGPCHEPRLDREAHCPRRLQQVGSDPGAHPRQGHRHGLGARHLLRPQCALGRHRPQAGRLLAHPGPDRLLDRAVHGRRRPRDLEGRSDCGEPRDRGSAASPQDPAHRQGLWRCRGHHEPRRDLLQERAQPERARGRIEGPQAGRRARRRLPAREPGGEAGREGERHGAPRSGPAAHQARPGGEGQPAEGEGSRAGDRQEHGALQRRGEPRPRRLERKGAHRKARAPVRHLSHHQQHPDVTQVPHPVPLIGNEPAPGEGTQHQAQGHHGDAEAHG